MAACLLSRLCTSWKPSTSPIIKFTSVAGKYQDPPTHPTLRQDLLSAVLCTRDARSHLGPTPVAGAAPRYLLASEDGIGNNSWHTSDESNTPPGGVVL